MQRLLQLARILADPGQPPDLLQAVELAIYFGPQAAFEF